MKYKSCKSNIIKAANVFAAGFFKLYFLFFTFIFIGCGSLSSTNLTINNNSDYTILNVYYSGSEDFGTIKSKENSTREIRSEYEASYDQTGYITFFLLATDGNIFPCKTSRDIRINKRKNEYDLNNNTVVYYSDVFLTFNSSYDYKKNGVIKDIAGPLKTATLTINNMTDYSFFSVEYDSVDFGSISSGRDSKKNVSPGTKFIYFTIQPKSSTVRCRTEPLTCKNGNNSIIIINSTVVTVVGGETADTIKNLYEKYNK